jgi:hypothetical protein
VNRVRERPDSGIEQAGSMIRAITRFFDRFRKAEVSDFIRAIDDLNVARHGGRATIGYGEIGELALPSSAVVIGDPMDGPLGVVIENIRSGRVKFSCEMWEYPDGALTPRRLDLEFEPGRTADDRRVVGSIGVESGQLFVADRADCESNWTTTGVDRIGIIQTARDQRVVKLLKKQFGLKVKQVRPWAAEVVGPVSEALESEIEAYLKTIPEFAQFPFLYFRVDTNNTAERAGVVSGPGAFIPIGNSAEPQMLVCKSGRGDGCYQIIGQYDGDVPCRASVVLISDEDD